MAIEKLKKAQTLYQDSFPHYTEIFLHRNVLLEIRKQKEAVKYLKKKIRQKYYKDKNQDPQFRPAYELLIEYYASKNNTDKQLKYINKLMSLDKSYEKNYKYLLPKFIKNMILKLIDEKNSIENSLKIHQYLTLFVIIISIVLISFSTYKYFQMQRKYKERFEQIISKKYRN